MSECRTCGREDGHHLGCAKAFRAERETTPPAPEEADQCAFGDCTEPRKSTDKRVKFCEFHSDPKNRK